MKGFIREFKEFISNGNVMSMAVGIIIGGAFTAIVNSLVSDIITPLLGMILGGINFSGISITVGDANLLVGRFIQSVIMFILTALVIFVIMKGFNKFATKRRKKRKHQLRLSHQKRLSFLRRLETLLISSSDV